MVVMERVELVGVDWSAVAAGDELGDISGALVLEGFSFRDERGCKMLVFEDVLVLAAVVVDDTEVLLIEDSDGFVVDAAIGFRFGEAATDDVAGSGVVVVLLRVCSGYSTSSQTTSHSNLQIFG